jgi:predicted AlkP superfamily phosphohydrolase/phosphomutase
MSIAKKIILVFILTGGVLFLYRLNGYSKNKQLVKKGMKKYNKVLIVGIDGMDPKMLNAFLQEGKLPNFQKLITRKNLETVNPPQSPVAWVTIATGVNPGKHNIFDFIRRNPDTYMPMLGLFNSKTAFSNTRYSSLVDSQTFWELLSENGINSTIIRWPMTFPANELKGELLSGLGVPDLKGFLSGYTLYTEKYIPTEKDSNKVEIVKFNQDNIAHTKIYGPRFKQGSEIKDITADLSIERIDDKKVKLSNDGKEIMVQLGQWSDWITTEFAVNFFTKKSGNWKVYLESIKPLKLFMTTMQINPLKPITPISFPTKYSEDLAGRIGRYYTLGIAEETDGLLDGALSDDGFIQQVFQLEEEREKMFWSEFDKFKQKNKVILAVVFDSSDRLQHTHWQETNLEKGDPKITYDKTLERYYANKDKFLGKVLNEIDDQTAVIILSDHGFTSFERGLNLNTWLKNNHYLTLTKEVTDADDGSLFKNVDWKKTKAYAVGFNAIYLNKKGREKEGIVENDEKVIAEIVNKLESLIDEKTGKKVIYKAYRGKDIWQGKDLKNAPDVVIGYYPGYRTDWKTAIGGFTVKEITDNQKRWKGDHMVDKKFVPGVLLANFPVKEGVTQQVDIAPTVYNLLNVEVPKNIFDGKSIY